jgi:hypothetical protein
MGPLSPELVNALGVERHAGVFDSGLATCGPVGSFRAQINYWEHVRVLFDFFFPGVLPGSAVDIPPEVLTKWETVYEPAILQALAADPSAAGQSVEVAQIPTDPQNPELSAVEAVRDVLCYNVHATNEGVGGGAAGGGFCVAGCAGAGRV